MQFCPYSLSLHKSGFANFHQLHRLAGTQLSDRQGPNVLISIKSFRRDTISDLLDIVDVAVSPQRLLGKHAEGHVCVIARSSICVYTLSSYLGSGSVLVLAALSHDGRIVCATKAHCCCILDAKVVRWQAMGAFWNEHKSDWQGPKSPEPISSQSGRQPVWQGHISNIF